MPNYSFEITTESNRYIFIWDTNCEQLVLRSHKFNGIVKHYHEDIVDGKATVSFEDEETKKEVTFTTSAIKSCYYF